MSKAKLNQMANTWLEEESSPKKKRALKKHKDTVVEEITKKKQTFSLRMDTIKCLWEHRVETGKTISATMDELVLQHILRK